jgi:hypothetical protein
MSEAKSPSELMKPAITLGGLSCLIMAATLWSSRTTRHRPLADVVSIVAAIVVLAYSAYAMRVFTRIVKLQTSPPDEARTPRIAKFVLLLVPRKNREYLLGDLEEEYLTILLPDFGLRAAQFWYWCQVLSIIRPFLWAGFKRFAGFVLLWKSVR